MLLAAALFAPAPVVTAEAGAGLGICGASGAVDCARAERGLVVDLRGIWHAQAWLGVGVTALYATLPAEGTEAGNLLYLGPEMTLRGSPTPDLGLLAGLTAGFDRIAGTGGRQTGWGGLGLRLGGRYRVAPHVELGLDYGLLRPRLDEICEARCGQAEVALLHRFSMVVGVPFW